MTSITFTVLGIPKPRGSKKAFTFRRRDGSIGASITDDNPKSDCWMNSVREKARSLMCDGLLEGPLSLQAIFYFPRPKGHFCTGKNCDRLRTSAPLMPITKPDIDKLIRNVADALTGVLYRDDSQIVEHHARKWYDEPARVEISLVTVRPFMEPDGSVSFDYKSGDVACQPS